MICFVKGETKACLFRVFEFYECDGSFAHVSAHVLLINIIRETRRAQTLKSIRRKVRITTKVTFFFVAERAYTTRI